MDDHFASRRIRADKLNATFLRRSALRPTDDYDRRTADQLRGLLCRRRRDGPADRLAIRGTGDVQWTSFNFTYGTVTYKAKFPPQDTSTWPAIWLLGSNCQNTNPYTAATDYDTCPSTASTRMPRSTYGVLLDKWCQLALSQQSSFPACGYPVDDNWHTFTLVWTATSITESVTVNQLDGASRRQHTRFRQHRCS